MLQIQAPRIATVNRAPGVVDIFSFENSHTLVNTCLVR